jgi:hypothetical protein
LCEAAQADVDAAGVGRIVKREKLEVARQEMTHLARHRAVVPTMRGAGVLGEQPGRNLAQPRFEKLALVLDAHARIAVAGAK